MNPRYTVGTKFWHSAKHKVEATVIDIWTTRNLAGEVVKVRYVATHQFLGQTVTDHDVNDVTIARNLIS